MKQIISKSGVPIFIDDDMYQCLSQWKWYVIKSKGKQYAVRSHKENGKWTLLLMHHQIIGKKDGLYTDHIDGNGLNNQRKNLRHVTPRQNQQNRKGKKGSKYPGVKWNLGTKKWESSIRINDTRKYLGAFTDEYEAFLAYKSAVNIYTGEEVI